MAIPSSITDLDTNEAMNSPAGSDNVGGTLDNFLRSHAAIIRRQFSKGADINSASTTVLPPDCSFANVKKVASTINGFSDNFNGRIVYLKFDAGITLAHSSALMMPAGVSVVTEANDIVCFMNESPGAWKCLSYPRYTDADHPGPEPVITWPCMRWADTGNMLLKRRTAANDNWIVEGALFALEARTPSFSWSADVGTTNAYVGLYEPGVYSYANGLVLRLRAGTANTGPATFSPSTAVGALPIYGADGGALTGGEIAADKEIWLQYSGSVNGWLLIYSQGGYVKGVAPSASDNSAKLASTSWIRSAMSNIASAAGFAINLSGTGYIKFPSWLGSWLVQWGAIGIANGSYSATVVLPLAFSAPVTRAFACDATSSGTPLAAKVVTSAATTSFDLLLDGPSINSRVACWLAIGSA